MKINRSLFKVISGLFFSAAVLSACRESSINTAKIRLDGTDTTRNFYTAVIPSGPPAAYMILLPGFGESADRLFEQTDLPRAAVEKGILVIIPALQEGVLSFGFEDKNQSALDDIVKDAVKRYGLSGKTYFIGGFSMGGTAAVKYAETATDKPGALFAIDSPLDLERFYRSNRREIYIFRKDKEDDIYTFLDRRIAEIMGGPPDCVPDAYRRLSPFSLSDTAQLAIQSLIDMPVRIYIEPNPAWWLEERKTDAFGLNTVDCSAFINQLRHLGNRHAELIVTRDKGCRKPSGQYHPHSWSIVDNGELLQWLFDSAKQD